MEYRFEWDPNKARSNFKKHGISFELAAEIFRDPLALSVYDKSHSENEDRWITIGKTQSGRFLVLVHTYTSHNDNSVTIRIISAREAIKSEIKQYEQN